MNGAAAMKFILAQTVGVLTAVSSLVFVQFKEPKYILLGQFLSNGLSAVSYGLLGSLSGAWICILASVQTVWIYFLNRKKGPGRAEKKILVSLLFAAAYIIGTVIVYKGWADIISCVCAMLFVLTIIQERSGNMRIVIMINMVLWIIFDLASGAYANMLTHGGTLVSTVTALLRLDKKPAENN